MALAACEGDYHNRPGVLPNASLESEMSLCGCNGLTVWDQEFR